MKKRRRGEVVWRAVAWFALSGALYIIAAVATGLPGWMRIVAALLGGVATSSYAVALNRPQRNRGESSHRSAQEPVSCRRQMRG